MRAVRRKDSYMLDIVHRASVMTRSQEISFLIVCLYKIDINIKIPKANNFVYLYLLATNVKLMHSPIKKCCSVQVEFV